MGKNRSSIFNLNSPKKENNIKIYCSVVLILLSIGAIIFYEIFNYKILIKDFISYFDQNKYSQANNLILTTQNYNPVKSLFLEKDLTIYFSEKVTDINTKYNSGELSETDALNILNELSRYNILIDDSNRLVKASSTSESYENALILYQKKDFAKAYEAFLLISSDDLDYTKSIEYAAKSKQQLKDTILSESKELANNHYYTKALELIDSANNIIGSDSDIKNTISEIKNNKNTYLADKNKDFQEASTSVINSISTTSINTLSLESLTPYLIYVNLTEQKTFVYSGNINNWTLKKAMACSTGTIDESTPQGVYTVKEKGEWFYSDKYKQGGKYWVQFMGDYLFHSFPYDKDKTTVLDTTLGVKSSHGCIRLSLDDSKWLYDNLKPGTKIIIK